MDSLAKFYIDHLFRLFRQDKGHTPAPSEHPSRTSSEIYRSVAVDLVPKDHSEAKKAALKRDGYRCMVTRLFDGVTDTMTDEERTAFDILDMKAITFTNFCYIFPPLLGWYPKDNLPRWSGHVRNILNSLGGIDVLAELDGDKIHRLSNGLILDTILHSAFDNLELWFEEVPNQPNTYTICASNPNLGVLIWLPHPLVITFTTTTDLELPNPKYLKLHAAVCRVAHMSGVAAYLDLQDREVEEKTVLDYDGSSMDLLASRLQGLC